MRAMTTLESVKNDVDALYHFRDHYFELFPIEEAAEKTKSLTKRLDQTISLIDQLDVEIQKKSDCLLLRGRALNVLPHFNHQVEECLSKAVKLDPKLSEAWIQLGESYWKKGDIKSAQNCFTGSLSHSRNKVALRNLSMVRRQLSKNEVNKTKSIEESVELAKEAIQLDVTDGTSWLVLGNAYLSLFFVKTQDPNTLKQCFSAYKQAERDVVTRSNPDLHYNRATLYQYEESYEDALIGYSRALALDPMFEEAKVKEETLLKYLRGFSNLIVNKGKISAKKLQSMTDSLNVSSDLVPYVSDGAFKTSSPSSSSASVTLQPIALDQLKPGMNSDKVVTGKVVCSFNVEEAVSFSFCLVDKCLTCVGVTVYNIAPGWGVKIGDSIAIPQPHFQQSNFTYKDENFQLSSVRVDSPPSLIVNGRKLGSASVATPTLSLLAKSE